MDDRVQFAIDELIIPCETRRNELERSMLKHNNAPTSHQLSRMLEMQDLMNTRVDGNWVSARHPYLRAVVIEAAEAIEHHGWKWWKKQQKDLAQLQMELIDIWHFLLSEVLLRNKGDHQLSLNSLTTSINSSETNIIIDEISHEISAIDLISKLELLIACSSLRRVEVGIFSSIMRDCQLSWAQLYAQYIGKNVLNFFRQDNGYKEGTYRKEWNGREDNEYLVEIINDLDAEDSEYQEKLRLALQESYDQAR